MALTRREIVIGAIAYFDTDFLNDDVRVTLPLSPVRRSSRHGNGFVCYAVDGNISYWAALTSTERERRLQLLAQWITNTHGNLARGRVWINDGTATYFGPHAAFIEASYGENEMTNGRPRVLPVGMDATLEFIRQRGGYLPPAVSDAA